MYSIIIPKKQMSDLWALREFAAAGPIAQQIREAVSAYIQVKQKEIGCPISDVQQAREQHYQDQQESLDCEL